MKIPRLTRGMLDSRLRSTAKC